MSYDIFLDASSTERKPFGFGYTQAVKVTGATRVAQRFLKHLLTPAGTDLSGAIQGTNFPELVGGNITEPGYMNTVVHIAVDQAAQQVKALETDPAFDGPGLASATVTKIDFGTDKLDVYLKLLTTDNQVAQLILPVTTGTTTAARQANIARYGALLQGL